MKHRIPILFMILTCLVGITSLSGLVPYHQDEWVVVFFGDGGVHPLLPYFLQRIFYRAHVQAIVFNEVRTEHTSWDYLQFLKANYERIANLHPDVVLVQIGLYDTIRGPKGLRYTSTYNNILKIIRISKTFTNKKGDPTILLLSTLPRLLPNPPLPYRSDAPRRVRAQLNPFIRELAYKEHIVLVEMEDIEMNFMSGSTRVFAGRWFHALMPYFEIFEVPSFGGLFEE